MVDFIDIDVQEESFVIDNDVKAEWALKKIAEIEQEYYRYSDVCQQQIDFYQQKADKAKQERDNSRNGLVGMLAQYFESVPSKATKTQATYRLPSGKLVKKLEKNELKYDQEKLIASLKGTPFVEEKPSLKWGEYKKTLQSFEEAIVDITGEVVKTFKVVDENGEIVDGVTVEVKPESFDVEVG